ncbi:D-isomer specific 2-hydroxyacid dehydrogenase family protein [Aciditerrimonas ferrireducens]|uniref:D-isomer specific 2-hydroxyacid dehydrogenase family protein n=1 Tax=Aciditerrimonas ferrireducens TaxID=667306 RepID=A0ABV6C013_9ACTN
MAGSSVSSAPVSSPAAPRVLVGPRPARFATDAVEAGGGRVVAAEEQPEAVVWLDPRDMAGLASLLQELPTVRWVQLPFAGVERAVEAGLIDPARRWSCAKGAYAEPVAEHALALALGGLRRLPERARASSWGEQGGISLYDQPVCIVGGGGIAQALLGLLAPFRARATVVRRRPDPVPGAERVLRPDRLHDAVADALVVVLCLALTPETRGLVDESVLRAMRPDAWLVNVARGGHVVTDDLVRALEEGWIGGAALDVTDPEPLPEGHPLWQLPTCLITPHTADTWEMIRPLLARRVQENVARFARGEPLVGEVDPSAGY